jgi:hypothetical protein
MDKIATLALGSFTQVEVGALANEAQEELVIQRFDHKLNKINEGFESTEKRAQDLAELVRYKNITTFTNGFFPNSKYAALPDTLLNNVTDYSDVHWFTIFEDATVNLDDCGKVTTDPTKYTNIPVYRAPNQALNTFFTDPFNKPTKERVYRLTTEGHKCLLLHTSELSLISYNIGYVRKPKPIDLVNTTTLNEAVSELSDHMHNQLLNKTVELALKNIESERYNTESQINKH